MPMGDEITLTRAQLTEYAETRESLALISEQGIFRIGNLTLAELSNTIQNAFTLKCEPIEAIIGHRDRTARVGGGAYLIETYADSAARDVPVQFATLRDAFLASVS